MRNGAVEVISPEGTAAARSLRIRGKHQMVDDQLAFSDKQVIQRDLAGGAVKHIILFNTLPRQLAPLPAELRAQAREFLLLRQETASGFDPFIPRSNLMIVHKASGCVGGP